VYQPPFAEFVILHVNLLSHSDYFSNAVQFFFLLLCFPALLSLLDEMGIRKYPLWIVTVLLFTIPNVVLQASSTQNDIVVSFFILSATGFALKSFREGGFLNFLYLGFSVGLAFLTKGTAYIFLAPILIIFGLAILDKTITSRKLNFIHLSLVAALVAMTLNTGHFYRNQQLSGNILGTSVKENNRYVNQVKSADVMTSNLLKNMSLQLGPYPLSRISKFSVVSLHKLLGLNADDPGANWQGGPFLGASDFPSHEDSAANPFHFLLIFIAVGFIIIAWLKRSIRVNHMILLLMLIIFFQMLLFCWYLRWQPWHSRLHTTGFMLSIPIIIYAYQFKSLFMRMVKVFIPILLVYAFLVILFNRSSPYLSASFTRDISVFDSRAKKIYANKFFLFDEYESIKNEIERLDYRNIGLILDREDWEYPLFRDIYTRPIRPVHIMVDNVTLAAPYPIENVNCIVATTVNEGFIEYMGQRYFNQSPVNKYVWFYRAVKY
jgi:4-amino-4-deoxy-L-arabinose transferase-like glycosyltransferase